ncbi:MAG TPA: ABC transporter permease subunit [Gemmataceae bacterium]
MSSNVIEPPAIDEAANETRPAPIAVRDPGWRGLAIALGPPLAAGAALGVHGLLPVNAEIPMSWLDAVPAWRHPYPVMLGGVLGASLLLALMQWAWRPLRAWVQHYAPLWTGALGAACLWEIITLKLAWLPQPYFPGPNQVLGGLLESWRILLDSAWHSLLLLAAGYASGVCAGVVTGVLIGWFPRGRYWIMPAMKVLGPIPATALVPLVMTVFPGSFTSGAALIGWAVWFPVTMLTSSGIANVRLSYLDVARTLGAGRLYLIFRVAIPSALPNIFVGLFVGLLTSFLTLIVAETVGVKSGLGNFLLWQQGFADYGKVFAGLLIMAVFCSTILTLLFKLRDWVLKWQKGVIKW